MSRALVAGMLITAALTATAQAQAPAPPPFATTKVEGTDNVYIFRFGGHQSMFIVTKEGVIATDPISAAAAGGEGLYRGNPEDHQGADQIRDLQPQPLRSHRRRQAIQGCGRYLHRPQERQGAHRRAEAARRRRAGSGGRQQEGTSSSAAPRSSCIYVGKNHSDSTLVMRLPKEKIIFTVDWIPLQGDPVPRHGGQLSA